ncbi:hypothetical protein AXF42_Ash003082 [Apostasia shenzhenica]|uniref:Uncharacterized protein n=1 Tax=Apostasia shenzhenica TaxID=1088818 RepID=A0A2I0A876_9ASPA|nr:hypothetical protein AXF42_Ash003082 [Apostasia shenzhenica]
MRVVRGRCEIWSRVGGVESSRACGAGRPRLGVRGRRGRAGVEWRRLGTRVGAVCARAWGERVCGAVAAGPARVRARVQRTSKQGGVRRTLVRGAHTLAQARRGNRLGTSGGAARQC